MSRVITFCTAAPHGLRTGWPDHRHEESLTPPLQFPAARCSFTASGREHVEIVPVLLATDERHGVGPDWPPLRDSPTRVRAEGLPGGDDGASCNDAGGERGGGHSGQGPRDVLGCGATKARLGRGCRAADGRSCCGLYHLRDCLMHSPPKYSPRSQTCSGDFELFIAICAVNEVMLEKRVESAMVSRGEPNRLASPQGIMFSRYKRHPGPCLLCISQPMSPMPIWADHC